MAHKTPSYDINMLPKAVVDKTAFVKFKISNNFERNIDETDLKQPKIHRKINMVPDRFLKSQAINPRTNLCDFHTKNP
jgi:hypothetical protein